MARRIDGYVLRLRCARCERKFPHVIFSGDTDMATDGLCSLTAVGQDEVVVGEFDASERRLDYNGAENAFAVRISQLLDRNDLRVVRLLRSEPSSSPHGKYTAHKTIYSCPICPSGEAQEIEKMDWERFRAVGGQITIIGDMELLAGQMAEPGWTEVKRLDADDPHRGATGHVNEVASPSSAPRKRTRSRFALWASAVVAMVLALCAAAILAANFGIDFSLPRLS